MKLYFGDTESLTLAPTRIWLWNFKDNETGKHQYGYNCSSLIDDGLLSIAKNNKKVKKYGKLPKVYFFNLKWDGKFIIDYLVKNGYGEKENEHGDNGWFETSITALGLYYSIKIYYKTYKLLKKGNEKKEIIKCVELKDGSHLIKGSIASWGDKLGLPKGETPLYETLPDNYIPTQSEIDYIHRDCDVLESAFMSFRERGMLKDTQASNALYEFKQILGKGKTKPHLAFRKKYPVLMQDFNGSYRGGWNFVNPMYKGKEIENGYWYDIVSMYPFQMYYKQLPYGKPTEYDGYITPAKDRLYIYDVEINFRYKPYVIPFLRIKEQNVKYPKEFDGVTQLTDVDLKYLKKHAVIKSIIYIKSYEFKSTDLAFRKYIDKWFELKKKAKSEKDVIALEIAKIMLNSLYGKFGTSTENILNKPFLNKKTNKVSWKLEQGDDKEPVYKPVASFVTAYARETLILACENVGWQNVYYGDTDSIFCKVPLTNNIGSELGQWENVLWEKYKVNKFNKATFFETKRYCVKVIKPNYINLCNDIKLINEKISIVKCAGLKDKIIASYNYDKFKLDMEQGVKVKTTKTKTVIGGAIIYETEFTPKFVEKCISVSDYMSA